MSIRARALANLYRRNRITREGVGQAVTDGVITAVEYQEITGESLPELEG